MRPPHTAKRGSFVTGTVADAGERGLVERIRRRVGAPAFPVLIGIGDDAAVLAPARGRHDVLTTDALVEDVHFRRAWTDLRSVGRKAVTVNLSDLAAMGASPRALLLGLCLPDALTLEEFDRLIDGVAAEADAARAPLAGGNIARSPGPLVVSVTATGAVHARRMLRRDGAAPGDELYVSGAVGGAAAGLSMLESGVARASLDGDQLACVERYEAPTARIRCGRMIAGSRSAAAGIDLSDGLAAAVTQLAEASGTGVQLEADSLPIEPGAGRWWRGRGIDPVEAALSGGEDYELVFAIRPKRRRAFLAAAARLAPLRLTRIGILTREPAALVARGEHRQPLPSGYAHFAGKHH
jgi:thiamine-monophosphate kinase